MSRITRRTIIPVNQITPLTYRDGVTYIQLLTELSDYIKTILHPSLQHTVDQLVADVEHQMDTHHDKYVDGVQEFQRIHDAFMADVSAHLIALNDGAISDLVNDDTSMLGETLRSIFPDNEKFDVFHDQVAEIHRILGRQLDPVLSGILDTKAVIVMVGSSTSTRDEYPKELARLVHSQYQPGAFRTLRPSTWGPENNELKNSSLPDGVHVINAGWGGSAGADYVDDEMAQEISALNPTMVFHSIGANDWFHDRDPRHLTEQIARVINMIQSEGPLWHVLVHQHERVNTPLDNRYHWDEYLESLYDVATMYDNVIVVDAAEPMRQLGVGRGLNDRFNLMTDGSHLSEAGHKILARIVAEKTGFLAPGGVNDTGWLKVTQYSEHVQLQPQVTSSSNENLVYRVVGDAGGFTTYIRGIISRDGEAGGIVSFMEISPEWQNLLIPKTWFSPNDRHRIGWWNTLSSGQLTGGPVYINQSGIIHATNHHGDMGSVGFFVDAVIRS